MSILLVESCKLIKVVIVDAVAAFDGIQFLSSSPKVEALFLFILASTICSKLA